MLVGLQPYEENGRRCRYVQMDVHLPGSPTSFHEGVLRDAPNVNLSISYAEEQPDRPTRFALMLQQRVDLAGCRDQGIDAYGGTFTNGAYYWHDLNDPTSEPLTTTIGIVDGQPVATKHFPGVSPLRGDTRMDRDLLLALLARLQEHLSHVRGER